MEISISFSLTRGRNSLDNHGGKYGWVDVRLLIRYLLKPVKHPFSLRTSASEAITIQLLWRGELSAACSCWPQQVSQAAAGRPLMLEITQSWTEEALLWPSSACWSGARLAPQQPLSLPAAIIRSLLALLPEQRHICSMPQLQHIFHRQILSTSLSLASAPKRLRCGEQQGGREERQGQGE